MKTTHSIILAALLGGTVLTTSCRDDFAEINTDPSGVNVTTPEYLFTKAILKFEPSDYTYWFYNANDFYRVSQFGVPTGGVDSKYNEMTGSQGLKSVDMRTYANEIKAKIAEYSEEEQKQYVWLNAAMDVLSVYMGIFDSDFAGDITYSEAGSIWQNGPLTPKFDHVKDLYASWLESLQNDITILTDESNSKTPLASTQDVIYGGDFSKWAKLANSLRLKIAVRLYAQDPAQAKKVAEEVVNADCGYMDKLDESMIFNKATESTASQDEAYHWGNDVLQSIAPSQKLVNFMVDNRDPRARFMFTKNDWNSKIVELFINNGKESNIPSYIKANLNPLKDGKFNGWKGEGEDGIEPWWVRYYGLPDAFDAGSGNNDKTYGEYFNYNIADRCKFADNYVYTPFSTFQQEMLRGRVDFTLPTAPTKQSDGTWKANVVQDTKDVPWWGMYMTAGETNYYLAEMKVLGANLPKSAEEYFKQAITLSVEEYNEVAGNNEIPYYSSNYGYDESDATLKLKDGEINALVAQADYTLNGTVKENLEKIYLQEMIHFMLNPMDLFVTARRSGCPETGSSIFPRTDYSTNGIPFTAIPRRAPISALSPTDKMYSIYEQAYKDQGFTVGTTDKKLLNSERVWQDQKSPQWGAGPQE